MIDSVAKYMDEVVKIYASLGAKKHLFFRGHGNAKDFELIPTVLRPKENFKEKEILLDFKQYAPAHNIIYDYYSQRDRMLADMQHFGMPTRLLDWTVAPLNALFFCCSGASTIDGEVIIFNPWKYWSEIVRDKSHQEIHQIHITSRALLSGNWPFDDIKNYISKEFGYHDLQPGDIIDPFAFVANYTNDRIIHQRGCFTIHGTENKAFNHNGKFSDCFSRISIEASSKNTILDELNMLYINDYSIYPDFDGMKTLISKRKSLFNL